MTLSRLHDYNHLAAYFSSHAAAALASSTGASPTSASSAMSGFLQHGSPFLQKATSHHTHSTPLPSPFFLPTGIFDISLVMSFLSCVRMYVILILIANQLIMSLRHSFFITILVGIWQTMSEKKSSYGIFRSTIMRIRTSF